jgi:phosphoribosylformylglycinamidine synthase
MKFGVVTFPGSNCDEDMVYVLGNLLGQKVERLWHKDHDLKGVDFVVLPGGFSYGDYLRSGAIARFSPIMDEVMAHANRGGYVMGICNGFQVLTESHLLPGALTRNDHLHFICRDQKLRIENNSSIWTSDFEIGQEILIPLKNGEGGYVANEMTLDELEGEGRVIARYIEINPNGSRRDIAGITNARGNVVGIMPHPEHAVEKLTGPTTDGLGFFTSLLSSLVNDGKVSA